MNQEPEVHKLYIANLRANTQGKPTAIWGGKVLIGEMKCRTDTTLLLFISSNTHTPGCYWSRAVYLLWKVKVLTA